MKEEQPSSSRHRYRRSDRCCRTKKGEEATQQRQDVEHTQCQPSISESFSSTTPRHCAEGAGTESMGMAARAADEAWMLEALAQADVAASKGEVPVGCVLVDASGARLSAAHNLRQTTTDPTAHAEIVALRDAARSRKTW